MMINFFLLAIVIVHCLLLNKIGSVYKSIIFTCFSVIVAVIALGTFYDYSVIQWNMNIPSKISLLFVLLNSLPFLFSSIVIISLKHFDKPKSITLLIGILAGSVPLLPLYPVSIIQIIILLATCAATGNCV